MKSTLSIEAKHNFGLKEEKNSQLLAVQSFVAIGRFLIFLSYSFRALEEQQMQFSLCFFVQAVFLN